MTNLLPYATIQNTGGDIPTAAAGAAPTAQTGLNGPAQGNPDAANRAQVQGQYPPGPQLGGTAQTINTPALHAVISQGNVPVNVQPTTVGTGAGIGGQGTDSLMAQMSRGQVLLNQSTYGQGSFIPQNGGASPQAPQPGSVAVASVTTGAAGNLAAASTTYIGA